MSKVFHLSLTLSDDSRLAILRALRAAKPVVSGDTEEIGDLIEAVANAPTLPGGTHVEAALSGAPACGMSVTRDTMGELAERLMRTAREAGLEGPVVRAAMVLHVADVAPGEVVEVTL